MMKSTNIVVVAFLIIAGFALISMPQMIGSANAQSERASERACPVPGFTLSKGECTAEPTTKLICEPSDVGGVTANVVPGSELCRATTTSASIGIGFFAHFCSLIENSVLDVSGSGPGTPRTLECTFPATETITCPGDVPPTKEGECITKPGQGNDPT
jgi:hypothetical protein